MPTSISPIDSKIIEYLSTVEGVRSPRTLQEELRERLKSDSATTVNQQELFQAIWGLIRTGQLEFTSGQMIRLTEKR